jgi:hypothetical protein
MKISERTTAGYTHTRCIYKSCITTTRRLIFGEYTGNWYHMCSSRGSKDGSTLQQVDPSVSLSRVVWKDEFSRAI